LNAYERAKIRKMYKIAEIVWLYQSFNVSLPMSTRRERAKELIARRNKQLAAQQDSAKRWEELSRKNLHTAEIYIDVAKLVLGGVVIGNLFAEKEYSYYIISAGFLLFLVLLKIGNNYFDNGNKSM
jgi:hypothetical protein